MKVRLGYVTNSSSSSFVAIIKEEPDIDEIRKSFDEIKLGNVGEIRFTIEFVKVSDFYSKLNFIALQILYSEDEKQNVNLNIDRKTLNDMIEKDLLKRLNWSHLEYLKSKYDAYIDHDTINNKVVDLILKDINHLKRFLYSNKSILVVDSDEQSLMWRNQDIYFRHNSNYDFKADHYLEPTIEREPNRIESMYYFTVDSDSIEDYINVTLRSLLKTPLSDEDFKELIDYMKIEKTDLRYESPYNVLPFTMDILKKNLLEPYDKYVAKTNSDRYELLAEFNNMMGKTHRNVYESDTFSTDFTENNTILDKLATNDVFNEHETIFYVRLR